MSLTDKQKTLLNEIMNDKFSKGAFSGMITNLVWERAVANQTDIGAKEIEEVLRLALDVRLRLEFLAE